jgi:hypothetical protein
MSEVAEQIKKLNDRVGKLEEKLLPQEEAQSSESSESEEKDEKEEETGSEGAEGASNEGAGS